MYPQEQINNSVYPQEYFVPPIKIKAFGYVYNLEPEIMLIHCFRRRHVLLTATSLLELYSLASQDPLVWKTPQMQQIS